MGGGGYFFFMFSYSLNTNVKIAVRAMINWQISPNAIEIPSLRRVRLAAP